MLAAPFVLPKTLADLKYAPKSRGQQVLHTQFGGGLQVVTIGWDRIDMGFRRRRRYADGRIDLQVAVINKKFPNRLNNPGPQVKIGFYDRLSISRHN
jgi:hypothetical protein